jgi:transcriptional regulator with XRE-family HTH domain
MADRGPNPIDIHIGGRMRMRRQTVVGDALGVTFQQVQKYEQGVNRIAAGRLPHIARILQVPVEFLFHGAPDQPKKDGDPTIADYVSSFIATSEGKRLMKAFMRIQKVKVRRLVVSLVEAISEP